MDSSEPQTERRVGVVVDAFAKDTSAASRALVVQFLATLRQWNKKLDLTAAKTEDELVDLFVADAAVLAGLLAPGQRVCDVGAGAGAPGFVLALLRPDLQLTLIEPLAKRTSFLRTFWATHAATHAPSLRLWLEPVATAKARGDRFDVAVSRATFEPTVWLETGRDLLRPAQPNQQSPLVVLLHAKEDAPPGPPGLERSEGQRYVWPLTQRERQLTRYFA